MHLSHILQSTIQNRNVHISAPIGALWDMEQVHCVICEILLLWKLWENCVMTEPSTVVGTLHQKP